MHRNVWAAGWEFLGGLRLVGGPPPSWGKKQGFPKRAGGMVGLGNQMLPLLPRQRESDVGPHHGAVHAPEHLPHCDAPSWAQETPCTSHPGNLPRNRSPRNNGTSERTSHEDHQSSALDASKSYHSLCSRRPDRHRRRGQAWQGRRRRNSPAAEGIVSPWVVPRVHPRLLSPRGGACTASMTPAGPRRHRGRRACPTADPSDFGGSVTVNGIVITFPADLISRCLPTR